MLTRIRITNYRGIAAIDVSPPPGGVVAKGRNGAGKTTLLRAVKAALLAQDVSSDAIRKGADKAEILVDLDDISVRRVITAAGQRVDVTRAGFRAQRPQAMLTELLGTSSLDPLDLLLLKSRERRQRILEALPCSVTEEQLRQWWPSCPPGYDTSGHGLEVIASVRATHYAARTEANRAAASAKAAAKAAADRAAVLAQNAPANAPTVEDATQAVDESAKAMASLEERARRASEHEARTASARARIAALRAASAVEVPELVDLAPLESDLAAAERIVEAAEAALREAKRGALLALSALNTAADRNKHSAKARSAAVAAASQADELEAAVAATGIEAPTSEETDAARAAVANAHAVEAMARVAETASRARDEADALTRDALAAAQKADELDRVVKALDAAPAELLAGTGGIPGLALDGDDVVLDGVRLDVLSGAEQVRFCVEVARRANARAKILVVDGLERLDPEQYGVFVSEATRAGWQLIGTRVDRGDIVVEAIEPETAAP